MNSNIDSKRMAKNTFLLYGRMFLLLLIGFYNVRLLLSLLGIEDYGIYNIVFGLAATFSFFSGAMLSTVQRYLCYELGKGEVRNASSVFSVSLMLFVILAIVVMAFAETVGLWFICHKLNIPDGKIALVQVIYHFSVLMVIFKILQLPFMAAVTSHENMRVFAFFSIVEAVLHFVSIIALLLFKENRLIFFVFFYTLSSFVMLLSYIVYCRKTYAICRVKMVVDKKYLKEMFSFFSWSTWGAVASTVKNHGLNLLLNVFSGVVLNATWGIANQVGGVVSQFYGNFQQAFNPQILKSYNTSDRKEFFDLLNSCSKYSFLLIWLIAFPLLLQTEFLLRLWLGNNFPDSAVIFTRFMIITVVFDGICSPLWIAVQATGNIRRYQIDISLVLASTFVFSFIALKIGAPAYFVAVINAAIGVVALIYRLVYLHKNIGLKIIRYSAMVLLPCAVVVLITCFFGVVTNAFVGAQWYVILGYLILVSLFNLAVILVFGLHKKEKTLLFAYLQKNIMKR